MPSPEPASRSFEIIRADYADPRHQELIPLLLDAYARDPLGGGEPLREEVKANLVGELSKLPQALSLLGFRDGRPAGLMNAFFGFSTFQGRALLNIHDLIVLPEYRGLGLSQRLLAAAEAIAREKGCCKLTLEVQSGNEVAMGSYRKFGFSGYELDPRHGHAMFWQKKL
ncbi:MAG: GNAT family N-acetyltransferase [Fibrobacteres bacterium]|jgi:ribosomal protein S18 acetylase RimI-like enzyme|nr:GNAT family N-acetyltransferase [Fibrobacterota bacterium]